MAGILESIRGSLPSGVVTEEPDLERGVMAGNYPVDSTRC